MTDVFKLPVFPAADVFPMMAEDELQELAADISENGLREPVVIAEVADPETGELREMLIDGRNRRAACKLAKVTPEIRKLNGEDPTAYVLSANIHRRHMTKGQRAMAAAILFPEPERGKSGKVEKYKNYTSKQYISHARAVFAWSEPIAHSVLIGTRSLSDAYKEYQESKRSLEEDTESDEERIAELRARYPDLADKVVEEELSLKAAEVEAGVRDADKREKQSAMSRLIRESAVLTGSFSVKEQIEIITKMLDDPEMRAELRKQFNDDPSSVAKHIKALERGVPNLIAILKKIEGTLK